MFIRDRTCPALAANTSSYDAVVNPVISLLNSLLGPILGLVGAVGTLYCVLLGVKFAKAEEPQEREKAKAHLKNAIIGFVLMRLLSSSSFSTLSLNLLISKYIIAEYTR